MTKLASGLLGELGRKAKAARRRQQRPRRHWLKLGYQPRVVEDTARDLAVAAPQPQHQVQSGLLLDVVVRKRAPVFELLASEDQALLVRRDALLVLDLGLDLRAERR